MMIGYLITIFIILILLISNISFYDGPSSLHIMYYLHSVYTMLNSQYVLTPN